MTSYLIDVDENKFKWITRWRNLFVILGLAMIVLIGADMTMVDKLPFAMFGFLFLGLAMSAHVTTMYLIGGLD